MAAIVVGGSDLNDLATTTLIKWGRHQLHRSHGLSAQPWRLVTYAFLHAGFVHLFMNLWSLLLLGPIVERLTGTIAFLVIYVASAIAGGIASAAWHPSLVSVGASGAIVGIVGAVAGIALTSRGSLPPALAVSLQKFRQADFWCLNFRFPPIDPAHRHGLSHGRTGRGIRLRRNHRNVARLEPPAVSGRVAASAIVAIWRAQRGLHPHPGRLPYFRDGAAVWDQFP